MKFIYHIEDYFLSDVPEEITLSDRLWFYGTYGLILVMCLFVAAQIYL